MADIPTDNIINPIDFFRVKAEEASSGASKSNLQRAVDALCKFAGGAEITFDSFTGPMLGEWVTRLLFQGYTPKTISNNVLKRLATLYNKAVEAGLAKPTDVFRTFQNRLNSPSAENISNAIDPETFNKLQSMIRTDCHADKRRQLAKDILLFAIYNGGMSFEDIAGFKKNGYDGDSRAIREIIDRYSRARNRYLFPLNQIHSTPKQRARLLQCLLGDLLSGKGLKLSPNPSDTTFDLWAAAAMSCGISASDTAACTSARNSADAPTAFAVGPEIDAGEMARIRSRVETTLNDNPLRWYAMHLRPHVDFDKLIARLKEKDVRPVDIYYPMEEVVNKIGHKKVFATRPVISWLVFFRERVTQLDRLYYEIGDLAWGYRYINDISSPYAAISNSEIRQYQCALGSLTADTQILPDEAVKLQPGDYLVVLGGALHGRHAVFVSEKRKPAAAGATGRIVYRVKLAGGMNANWIVDQDPRLVRKITETQFYEIDRQQAPR